MKERLLFVEVEMSSIVGPDDKKFEGSTAYVCVPKVSIMYNVLKKEAIPLIARVNSGEEMSDEDRSAAGQITSLMLSNSYTENDGHRQLVAFLAAAIGRDAVKFIVPEKEGDVVSLETLAVPLGESAPEAEEIDKELLKGIENAIEEKVFSTAVSAFGKGVMKRAVFVQSDVRIEKDGEVPLAHIFPEKEYSIVIFNRPIDDNTGVFVAGIAIKKTPFTKEEIIEEINFEPKKEA